MKKIFKLTIFSFIGPFIATIFVVVFALLMQFLWKYIDDMVGKGLEIQVLAKLIFFASASFVPMAMPLSILLAAIMTFGKLAETYELVALKSAGVSLVRIMMPLTFISILLSGVNFLFANTLVPTANLKYLSLMWDIRNAKPALDIKEGVFYGGIDNYSIRINKKDKDGRHIHGIMIYDHTRGNGDDIVLIADRGEMVSSKDKRWLLVNLYDGTRYEEMPEDHSGLPSHPSNRLNFKTYNLRFDLSNFSLAHTKEELFKHNYQMLNLPQLNFYMDSLNHFKNRMINEQLDYSKPYFYLLRDTSKNAQPGKPPLFTIAPEGQRYIKTFPKTMQHDIVMRALSNSRTLKETYRIQSEAIKNLDEQNVKYLMEWHRKFTISIACLALFLIGAPLGAAIRKGGIGMPTVLAIGIFILYYLITIFSEKLAKEGVTPVWFGMWLPAFVLFPIGFYLVYRSNADRLKFMSNILPQLVLFFRRLGTKQSQIN